MQDWQVTGLLALFGGAITLIAHQSVEANKQLKRMIDLLTEMKNRPKP